MTAPQEPVRKTFEERQRDAAVQIVHVQHEVRARVEKIIFGERDQDRRRLGQLIQITDDDFVAEVLEYRKGDQESQWTTVVGGKRHHEYFGIVDMALLHLVVRRNDPEPHSSQAHWYAARVARVN